MTVRSAVLPVLLMMAIAAPEGTRPVEVDPALTTLLGRDFGFSSDDLEALADGKVIKRTLSTDAPGEVATVGAAWIDASVENFLTQFRDIVNFKRNENVLQVGRFSNPPVLRDLAALTIEPADLDAKTCRPGNCSVRLPADHIARFQKEIDWKAPDARAKSAILFKNMLLDHAKAYWSGTEGRITEYNDGKRAIRPAVEFAGVLKNSPYLETLVAGLPQHLQEFPAHRLTGTEDFLYWSKEKFGVAPYVTLTHVTIRLVPPRTVAITSKNIYASRYIDASLALTIASRTSGGGFVMVYANRSTASALKGSLSGIPRMIVERGSRNGLERILKSVKARLEKTSTP